MKCPLCKTEMRISENKLVRRQDGTIAYRMSLMCRSRECPNNGKVVETIYENVMVEDE